MNHGSNCSAPAVSHLPITATCTYMSDGRFGMHACMQAGRLESSDMTERRIDH